MSRMVIGQSPAPARAAGAAAALALAIGVAASSPVHAQTPPSGGALPPPAVEIAPVKLAPVTRGGNYVGTVVAIQQVDLRARVEGFLTSVDFAEGSYLKAGDRAFGIEKAAYQAALDSANANLEVAQASKAAADANLQLAELTLKRQTTLVRSDAVAQSAVDQAVATRDANAAQVKQAEAQISSAQAQIETAKLNLSYTDVVTPISGRVGKAQVTVGNLVSSSTGPLATVIQTDPIRVVFSISDLGYLTVVRALMPNAQGVGFNSADFVPSLKLSDGMPYPEKGKIAFINNTVDPSTGTIAVYADFPNPHLMLIPGQFVDVSVAAGQPQTLPVIPAAAVLQDQDGPYVFVLGDGNRATIRRIKTGDRVGTDWSVTSGLANGEVIIVSGIQKVRPGVVVAPQPAATGG